MGQSIATAVFGMSPEAWTALGTLILSGATLVLVAVGLIQIKAVRDENRKNRTLDACDRYDKDVVLYNCLRRLAKAKTDGSLVADPPQFRPDVTTLLNYLDSLAVGIAQGLYIEELARDHVEPILKRHVDQFLGPKAPDVGLNPANYAYLTELSSKWSNSTPRFQEKLPWWKRRKKSK